MNNFINAFTNNNKCQIRNKDKLEEYVLFCLEQNLTSKQKNSAIHHILPQAVFPEFKDLKVNKWNGAYLTNENHYIAHSILAEAVYNVSILSAWYAMNNKNFTDKNEPISIIGAEKYQELILIRNKMISDSNKNDIEKRIKRKETMSKIDETGLNGFQKMAPKIKEGLLRITESGLTVAQEAGKKVSKTVTTTYLENGLTIAQNTARINSIERKKISSNGKTVQENIIEKMVNTRNKKDANGVSNYQASAKKGALTSTTTYLENGLTIAQDAGKRAVKTRFSKIMEDGRTYEEHQIEKMSGQNNPSAKKVHIFNENGVLLFECFGNFQKICEENNLPLTALRNSYGKNGEPIYNTSSPSIIQRLKNQNLYKFKGWFAKII